MSTFIAFRKAAAALLRPSDARKLPKLVYTSLWSTSIRNISVANRAHPKNNQIPYDVVQLKDADGTLHHAQKLSKILESMDLNTHVLRLIAHDPPIVRKFTYAEDLARKLESKAQKKAVGSKRQLVIKEAHMSWHTAGADFDMKVGKIRDELLKGDVRMTIVFNPKPRVRNPPYPAMIAKADEAVNKVIDVGIEWRERDFNNGILKVYLQSTVKKAKLQLLTQHEVEEVAHDISERHEKQALRRKRKEEENARAKIRREEEAAKRAKELAESGLFSWISPL
ncbi:hypothetical protein JR316_0005098 [Psilocybe cubensis]|uniref:Uncharacterized protein n=2 Tax=Psilocybe cubensis TaxID=181762 RepID=A0ACB8H5E6_PSICU|nr:hypothetical protein JR316_0005098 [Psilocybe cubensis]KAH9482998.1 hypothetical protein JR316_0005098 [Psilocybe cubensis]